jgi:hypothetical protein
MELNAALANLEAGRAVNLGVAAGSPESGRNKVSRLLDEAAAFLKEGNLTEAERRLAEVLPLSPREERYFLLLSEVREGQQRWSEAIQARREGNAIAASGSLGRRANPVLVERLAVLYERAGKPLAAKETRRLLES